MDHVASYYPASIEEAKALKREDYIMFRDVPQLSCWRPDGSLLLWRGQAVYARDRQTADTKNVLVEAQQRMTQYAHSEAMELDASGAYWTFMRRAANTILRNLKIKDPKPFNSVTINVNRVCRPHRDPREKGLAVMFIFTGGKVRGHEFCLPEWRVALKAHDGDVIVTSLQELHGNLERLPDDASRTSIVFYHREENQ